MKNKKVEKQKFLKDSGLQDVFLQAGKTCLNYKEIDVITQYFGINCSPCSSSQIAQTLNVSSGRIIAIKNKAIAKLRKRQNALRIRGYQNRLLLRLFNLQNWENYINRCRERIAWDEVLAQNIKIEDLHLNTRAYNVLRFNKLRTLKAVLDYEEKFGLISLLNLGQDSYRDIKEAIEQEKWKN